MFPPSLTSLVRERSLLFEVLRSADLDDPTDDVADLPPAQPGHVPRDEHRSASSHCNGLCGNSSLQDLPKDLMLGFIAQSYLDAPVWHLCQLGTTSKYNGAVYADEALWRGFFEDRFREVSLGRVPKGPVSPSARVSYAQLHVLEKNFREGLYSRRNTLDNPHPGVPVLDVRVASGDYLPSRAYAALRNGSIMVYDLDPGHLKSGHAESAAAGGTASREERPAPVRAAPLQELRPEIGGGPALCCLPLNGVLVAGFALGRLGAWDLPDSRACMPKAWENAHAGRVSALAALGSQCERFGSTTSHDVLLSAGSDNVVKSWDLKSERFGQHLHTYSGHSRAVMSVAASQFSAHVFLTGSQDRSMRFWDARQGFGESASVAQWQHKDWVTCVELHPTKEHFAFSSDKCVHQWDLRQLGSGPLSTSHRHRKLISRFRVDPLRLASCSLDGCVKVSSLEPPEVRCASPVASPQASPTHGPSPSPVALSESMDVCTLRTSTDYVLSLDFDADRLFAGSADGCVEVYDFSHPGHFSSPFMQTDFSKRCGEPVDIQVTGLQEIEV